MSGSFWVGTAILQPTGQLTIKRRNKVEWPFKLFSVKAVSWHPAIFFSRSDLFLQRPSVSCRQKRNEGLYCVSRKYCSLPWSCTERRSAEKACDEFLVHIFYSKMFLINVLCHNQSYFVSQHILWHKPSDIFYKTTKIPQYVRYQVSAATKR